MPCLASSTPRRLSGQDSALATLGKTRRCQTRLCSCKSPPALSQLSPCLTAPALRHAMLRHADRSSAGAVPCVRCSATPAPNSLPCYAHALPRSRCFALPAPGNASHRHAMPPLAVAAEQYVAHAMPGGASPCPALPQHVIPSPVIARPHFAHALPGGASPGSPMLSPLASRPCCARCSAWSLRARPRLPSPPPCGPVPGPHAHPSRPRWSIA